MTTSIPDDSEYFLIDISEFDIETTLDNNCTTRIPTTLGIIANDNREVLTYDSYGGDNRPSKRALLPEATVKYPYNLENVIDAVPRRFNNGGGKGQLLGSQIVAQVVISPKLTPRLYVPVKYLDTPAPMTCDLPYALKTSLAVWRTPEKIFDVLAVDDIQHKKSGSQRRAITRFAILSFLEN